MPDLAGGQVSTDLATLVDLSAAAANQNVKSTLNDLFETITKNITAKTLIFEDALALRSVSAANTGKIDYNATAQSFQVSENGGAYQNLVKGVGANTRVAFWTDTDTLSSDGAFLWDETNDRLLINVSVANGAAPIDVLADGTAVAQQWRPNSGTMRTQMILDSGPETFLGTITAHNFHLITTNLQRLSIESGGRVGINKATAMAAQLHVISQDASTPSLFLQTANTPSANIAEFYNDAGIRFTFEPSGILTLGKTGGSGATGQLTFAVNGQAFTQTLRAGDTPAASNVYKWPSADPTLGQALTASAPAAGVVTLSWTTIASTSPGSPVNSVQFNDAGAFAGDSAFLWDKTNDRLLLGVSLANGAAPIDVLADGTAVAQQWRPNSGTMRTQMILDSGPETFLGTITAHNFHLITNNLQRLSIESGGRVGINKATAMAAQLHVISQDASTPSLFLQTANTPSANIAEFYNDAGIRFTFEPSGILTLGKTGASGATGQLTFAVNGQAFTQTLRGGAAPAASNTYLWPDADPTLGQVLTASAPVAGVVTLSWATGGGGTTINPTDGILPYRLNSTTFADSPISRLSSVSVAVGFNSAPTTGVIYVNYDTSRTKAVLEVDNTQNGQIRIKADGANGQLIAITARNSSSGTASFTNGGTYGFDNQITAVTRYALGASFATPDTGLDRFAAGVIRVSNASTGLGSILIGSSTDSLTGNFTVMSSNAATNSLVPVARLGVNSTGTAADGFGASLSWSAETSTTNDVETGRINVFWTTATHASRTSAISWSVVNNATLAQIMRLGTPSNNVGSPFVLTIHEGTNPSVWTNGSYAAKLYLLTTTLPAVGVAAHFSATALDAPQWQMLRGRGTNASPTAIQSSDSIGNIEWWGQTSTSTNNVVAGARIRVSATENWSAGNNGCQMIFFTSNNAGTITDRMYLKETGTLRIGATAGSYDTTNLLQVGNYASFTTGVTAAIYSGANTTIGMRLIGTNGQTANMIEIFRDSLTPNLLTLAASGVLSLRAGLNTGTTVARVGGTIHEDFTPVSNSGTGETDLQTYSVPANTLGTDNDYLEVEAFGEFTAPTGNATVKMKFGSTTIFDTSALAFTSGAWRLRARIVRGGATSQLTITSFDGDTALVTVTAQVAAPAETLSGAVTLKCTGQSGASSEVTQEGFIIKWQPASN